MKFQSSTCRISFDKLIYLFKSVSNKLLLLNPSIGNGTVQIFRLEIGLQARLWDCSFTEGIELYGNTENNPVNAYFTIAYFLDVEGLQFANGHQPYRNNRLWDNLFLSAISNFKLYIAPMFRAHCMSIIFSMNWLRSVLEGNRALKKVREKIYAADMLSLTGSMSLSERKLVEEMINTRWQKHFGTFYIKSAVLKIISDFFHRLKERDTLPITNPCPKPSITEVEQYLSERITGPLPDLKALAHQFSMSECTLKRQFKKRYGINMSTYFIRKKMEYARQMMQEKNSSVMETAHNVGYRSVHNFIAMFRKHFGSLPLSPRQ